MDNTTSNNKDHCLSIASLPIAQKAKSFGIEPYVVTDDVDKKLTIHNEGHRMLFCPNPISCPGIDADSGNIGTGNEYSDTTIDTCIAATPPTPNSRGGDAMNP